MTVPVEKIAARFKKLDCAAICDASPLAKSMDHELISIKSGIKMAGRAYPVVCSNDYLTVIKAMEEARPGDVLVVDGRGQSQAVFGELLALEAKRRGLSGAVVDGSVRDISGMRKIGFPIYYRWTNPQAGRAEIVEPPCETVSVGGVIVNKGDWILGDSDGVVVIPQGQIEVILDVADEIQRAEDRVAKSVSKGQILSSLLGLEEFRRDHERDIRTRLETYLSNKED